MSFSSEGFIKKLSGLQDTQESIVSISQWVLFHHRYAKDCAKIWSTFVLNSSSSSGKRLNLLYLCNDVVQRARRKRKPEFINEFAEILPSVMNKIYYQIDGSIKPKVDRLVNVWEERAVFDADVILKLRKAIKESKGTSSEPARPIKSSLASSTPSSSPIAPELKHLNDLFISLNQLTDISQSNLTQFGIQSKTYLPQDPSKSENLPAPDIYISKLNMLQKLSSVSISNLKDIKNIKQQISTQLASLSKVVLEGSKTDDTKISIIEDKVKRLHETRKELQEMVLEDKAPTPEEPSPEFDEDDDDDIIPTYEDGTDNDSDEPVRSESESKEPESITRKRPSRSPSGTPKRVAFSEDIEVKEFDREEDGNNNDDLASDTADSSESQDFAMHHKDVLELKHEHEHELERPVESDDEDGYDPAAGLDESQATSDNSDSPSDSPAVDVMSLLSKLS